MLSDREGREAKSRGGSEWLKTERNEPRWPVSFRLGPSCSWKVKDSSLTRKFKCVCVIKVVGPRWAKWKTNG